MGTRRKQPLTVYISPGDPVIEYLDSFRDKSKEALRLLQIGYQQVNVTAMPAAQAPQPTVTITGSSGERNPDKSTVTAPTLNAVRRDRVTVNSRDLDPAWDE